MKIHHWGQYVFLLLGMKGFCVLTPFLYRHISRDHVTTSWFSFYLLATPLLEWVAGWLAASLPLSLTHTISLSHSLTHTHSTAIKH